MIQSIEAIAILTFRAPDQDQVSPARGTIHDLDTSEMGTDSSYHGPSPHFRGDVHMRDEEDSSDEDSDEKDTDDEMEDVSDFANQNVVLRDLGDPFESVFEAIARFYLLDLTAVLTPVVFARIPSLSEYVYLRVPLILSLGG